ncbi:MAG TPA: aldo/keto reductase, partial [Terriglobales bacterium]|nr:aldo/keto reductase [Terriglobales bacterium]
LPSGMSLPEMALRFVLSHPAVSTVTVGMRKLEHVRENCALSDKGALSPGLLQELKKHRWDRKPAPWSD